MVIYMDQYRAVKSAPVEWLKNGTYGDEIMRASWNPAVAQMVRETAPLTPSPDLPDDLSTIDVNALLGRVYALATLI
jgi:hypothetical protein